MPIRSIRARLTFWYSALLTLTFLILGGAGYGLLVYNLAHDLDTALSGVAKVLAEQAGRSGGPPFSAEIDDVFRRFFGFSPWQRHFEVIPPPGFPERRLPPGSGRFPLSPQARENALRGIPTFETVRGPASGPVRLLTMPVAEGGRVASLIQVGMSLETTENTKRRFLLTMAALLPLGLLLAGGGGWALARRALRPVDQIAETARRISAERLDARLEETGANDELSRLIRTLNGMLERLDASFHQVRRFSADASHELQTPLTILKGEIEVALRSPRTPGQYQEILTSSLEEIDRLTRLVEGLMLLARADAGVLRLDAKPIPLDQLARDVCGQAQRLAETRRVTLALEEAEPLTILGDPDRLRQVLLNLADNGIKYTPAGGRVAVSLQREGSWACLRVADTGIGLSPEEQKRVFDRFYRSPEAKSQGDGGAGLGLCIARSVVEAHGGKIRVESAPGKGSTFAVFLPLPA